MADLSTTYMGLSLKNPVVVSSSRLTGKLENIKKMEEYGAGAVVLKSLFEEQITAENKDLDNTAYEGYHPEAWDYIFRTGMEFGPEKYIELIKESKAAVSIPVIASLNCVTPSHWQDFAKRIENAGTDALELNISYLTSDFSQDAESIEKKYLDIIQEVRKTVKIPVAVKMGPYFTATAQMVSKIAKTGIQGLVIFNRFYNLDIDVQNMEIKARHELSREGEVSSSLRWVSIFANRIPCDIAGNSGIHTGEDVIKYLLAGATVTQICSSLFVHGIEYIGTIVSDLYNWMDQKSFSQIDR